MPNCCLDGVFSARVSLASVIILLVGQPPCFSLAEDSSRLSPWKNFFPVKTWNLGTEPHGEWITPDRPFVAEFEVGGSGGSSFWEDKNRLPVEKLPNAQGFLDLVVRFRFPKPLLGGLPPGTRCFVFWQNPTASDSDSHEGKSGPQNSHSARTANIGRTASSPATGKERRTQGLKRCQWSSDGAFVLFEGTEVREGGRYVAWIQSAGASPSPSVEQQKCGGRELTSEGSQLSPRNWDETGGQGGLSEDAREAVKQENRKNRENSETPMTRMNLAENEATATDALFVAADVFYTDARPYTAFHPKISKAGITHEDDNDDEHAESFVKRFGFDNFIGHSLTTVDDAVYLFGGTPSASDLLGGGSQDLLLLAVASERLPWEADKADNRASHSSFFGSHDLRSWWEGGVEEKGRQLFVDTASGGCRRVGPHPCPSSMEWISVLSRAAEHHRVDDHEVLFSGKGCSHHQTSGTSSDRFASNSSPVDGVCARRHAVNDSGGSGPKPPPRYGHVAVGTPGGLLIVFGGRHFHKTRDDCWTICLRAHGCEAGSPRRMLNLVPFRWKRIRAREVKSWPSSRVFAAAVATGDCLLLFGGEPLEAASSELLGDLWCLDLKTLDSAHGGRWIKIETPDSPEGRRGHTLTLTKTTYGSTSAGSLAEWFSRHTTGSIHGQESADSSSLLPVVGEMICIGGETAGGSSDEIWSFDSETVTWRRLSVEVERAPQQLSARLWQHGDSSVQRIAPFAFHSAIAWTNGDVITIGGWTLADSYDEKEERGEAGDNDDDTYAAAMPSPGPTDGSEGSLNLLPITKGAAGVVRSDIWRISPHRGKAYLVARPRVRSAHRRAWGAAGWSRRLAQVVLVGGVASSKASHPPIPFAENQKDDSNHNQDAKLISVPSVVYHSLVTPFLASRLDTSTSTSTVTTPAESDRWLLRDIFRNFVVPGKILRQPRSTPDGRQLEPHDRGSRMKMQPSTAQNCTDRKGPRWRWPWNSKSPFPNDNGFRPVDAETFDQILADQSVPAEQVLPSLLLTLPVVACHGGLTACDDDHPHGSPSSAPTENEKDGTDGETEDDDDALSPTKAQSKPNAGEAENPGTNGVCPAGSAFVQSPIWNSISGPAASDHALPKFPWIVSSSSPKKQLGELQLANDFTVSQKQLGTSYRGDDQQLADSKDSDQSRETEAPANDSSRDDTTKGRLVLGTSGMCAACAPGHFDASALGFRAAGKQCHPCPPGFYQPLYGAATAESCTLCPPGTKASSPASAHCTPCGGNQQLRIRQFDEDDDDDPHPTTAASCPLGTSQERNRDKFMYGAKRTVASEANPDPSSSASFRQKWQVFAFLTGGAVLLVAAVGLALLEVVHPHLVGGWLKSIDNKAVTGNAEPSPSGGFCTFTWTLFAALVLVLASTKQLFFEFSASSYFLPANGLFHQSDRHSEVVVIIDIIGYQGPCPLHNEVSLLSRTAPHTDSEGQQKQLRQNPLSSKRSHWWSKWLGDRLTGLWFGEDKTLLSSSSSFVAANEELTKFPDFDLHRKQEEVPGREKADVRGDNAEAVDDEIGGGWIDSPAVWRHDRRGEQPDGHGRGDDTLVDEGYDSPHSSRTLGDFNPDHVAGVDVDDGEGNNHARSGDRNRRIDGDGSDKNVDCIVIVDKNRENLDTGGHDEDFVVAESRDHRGSSASSRGCVSVSSKDGQQTSRGLRPNPTERHLVQSESPLSKAGNLSTKDFGPRQSDRTTVGNAGNLDSESVGGGDAQTRSCEAPDCAGAESRRHDRRRLADADNGSRDVDHDDKLDLRSQTAGDDDKGISSSSSSGRKRRNAQKTWTCGTELAGIVAQQSGFNHMAKDGEFGLQCRRKSQSSCRIVWGCRSCSLEREESARLSLRIGGPDATLLMAQAIQWEVRTEWAAGSQPSGGASYWKEKFRRRSTENADAMDAEGFRKEFYSTLSSTFLPRSPDRVIRGAQSNTKVEIIFVPTDFRDDSTEHQASGFLLQHRASHIGQTTNSTTYSTLDPEINIEFEFEDSNLLFTVVASRTKTVFDFLAEVLGMLSGSSLVVRLILNCWQRLPAEKRSLCIRRVVSNRLVICVALWVDAAFRKTRRIFRHVAEQLSRHACPPSVTGASGDRIKYASLLHSCAVDPTANAHRSREDSNEQCDGRTSNSRSRGRRMQHGRDKRIKRRSPSKRNRRMNGQDVQAVGCAPQNRFPSNAAPRSLSPLPISMLPIMTGSWTPLKSPINDAR